MSSLVAGRRRYFFLFCWKQMPVVCLDEFSGLVGWVRVRMENGERTGSASQIIMIIAVAIVASVAVTILLIALILLLVDPFDDVLMAIY